MIYSHEVQTPEGFTTYHGFCRLHRSGLQVAGAKCIAVVFDDGEIELWEVDPSADLLTVRGEIMRYYKDRYCGADSDATNWPQPFISFFRKA